MCFEDSSTDIQRAYGIQSRAAANGTFFPLRREFQWMFGIFRRVSKLLLKTRGVEIKRFKCGWRGVIFIPSLQRACPEIVGDPISVTFLGAAFKYLICGTKVLS